MFLVYYPLGPLLLELPRELPLLDPLERLPDERLMLPEDLEEDLDERFTPEDLDGLLEERFTPEDLEGLDDRLYPEERLGRVDLGDVLLELFRLELLLLNKLRRLLCG